MTEEAKLPQRLKPFYETPEPGEAIVLLEENEATLKQEHTEVKGTVKITQEWSPMGLYLDFTATNCEGFKVEEVEIVSKSFKAKARVFNVDRQRVLGFINGKVEIGTDHKLDRVTFHLANYPDSLFGGHSYDEDFETEGKTISIRWSEVILEADGWRIALQPHRDILVLRQKALERREVVLSGVGEIRKIDGSQFKKKTVGTLLEALRIFLSFAFAEWSPPLLSVGSNQHAEKSCESWSNCEVPLKMRSQGWVDEDHGHHLATAFPGFMARWANENWQEPLELSVTWLIEASRRSGGTEGAVAFGQIPLEMLAWLMFVDDKTIVGSHEFENLSAASKLQMLLAYCGIPLDVPSELTALSTIATMIKNRTGTATTGPQLATRVRNTVIHPNKKNRQLLSVWQKDYGVEVGDVRWETQQLFKWYITLVLLYLIGYRGKYAKRLTPRKLGVVEPVPWATPTEKPTT